MKPVPAPSAARRAPAGPATPPGKAGGKAVAPLAPAWMNGFAKGLDVTTQFRDAAHPLFDWDAVLRADQFRVPGGGVVTDRISFVVIKASIGHGVKSEAKNFTQNWAKLSSMYMKVIRGAYHFMLFGPNSNPVAQAETYLKAVGPALASLPPILDVEDGRPEVLRFLGIDPDTGKVVDKPAHVANAAKCVNDIQVWVDTVRAATHREPIIYTFPSYWKDTLRNPQDFKHLPLWLAHFVNVAKRSGPVNVDFGGWTKWTYWQFAGFPQTRTQFVPGIGSGVDLNLFNGTAVELQAQVYRDLYTPSPTPVF
jgi:GH25 family lysozyme M1 (1,4-beta-N-acetylmuramidase)